MDKSLEISEMMAFDTSYWKGALCQGKRLTRHWIYKALFLQCWQRFRASLATVDWTKKQTAQSLFNVPYWQSMNFGTRIAIGRVLRYFVDNGWLTLVVLNPTASGTKHYGWNGG